MRSSSDVTRAKANPAADKRSANAHAALLKPQMLIAVGAAWLGSVLGAGFSALVL
jgi:hypothetical protein